MKACRAPSTCHKATEEDLSRIDTLVRSYPKVSQRRRVMTIHLLLSIEQDGKLSKMA